MAFAVSGPEKELLKSSFTKPNLVASFDKMLEDDALDFEELRFYKSLAFCF